MNYLESQEATAQELVNLARQRGIDLESSFRYSAFLHDDRFISVWRKDGKIHYSLQGKTNGVPQKMQASADIFRGMWIEAGTFESLEQAVEFLKAWLLDGKKVDDLPSRCVRSYGI